MKFNIAIIYGSVRHHRVGINGAKFLQNQLAKRGHEVHFIDPLAYPLPLLDKMHKEYDPGTAPKVMEELHNILTAADAFVVVSGEYNHSVPAALKNILDHFQREYFFKPSAVATYSVGPFGGVRVADHVRAILGELGMPAISSSFAMSKVGTAFDAEGNALEAAYETRVVRFLDELEWYAEAFKTQRQKGTPY